MKPNKSKPLSKGISTDIPQEDVDLIISEYWASVRSTLSNLEHIRVHVDNLGYFYVKPWSLDKYILKVESRVLSPFTKPSILLEYNKKREDLLRLRDFLESEKQRKEFIKLFRDEKNIEKPTSDS